MSFAHLRRHASLQLARLREFSRSQIKDLLSASGFQPSLESHFLHPALLTCSLTYRRSRFVAPAHRLRGYEPAGWKMLLEKPACGFFSKVASFYV